MVRGDYVTTAPTLLLAEVKYVISHPSEVKKIGVLTYLPKETFHGYNSLSFFK